MVRNGRGWRALQFGLLSTALVFIGCAPQQPAGGGEAGASPGTANPRTLVMAFRYEAVDLSSKIPDPVASGCEKPLFNAALSGLDDHGVGQPYLAEALPKLNTDTWRVFSDGGMETTYRLRAGMTWHDGESLTADDFVFAWRLYTDPSLGIFTPRPQDMMQDVTAPDPRTVVIRWRAPFTDADILDQNFPPLPHHILDGPYAEYRQDPASRDRFTGLRFWTTEYVGLGPYWLERWEPGTALYAQAFGGYVFGKPKIDRIVARIFADENTVLANVLSGEVDITYSNALRFEHALVLKREWNGGVVALAPAAASVEYPQFRPEYQKTPALYDLRVRKALMHSIDKQALHDGLFGGLGTTAHSTGSPEESFFPQLDRVITKYDYDPRKTEAFMNDAGFVKDATGFFADANGERFRPDF